VEPVAGNEIKKVGEVDHFYWCVLEECVRVCVHNIPQLKILLVKVVRWYVQKSNYVD